MHESYDYRPKQLIAINGGLIPAPCATAAAIGDCGHVLEVAAHSQRLSDHVVNKADADWLEERQPTSAPSRRLPLRAGIRLIARFSRGSANAT